MTDIPSRAEQAREWLRHLEQSRDEQPTRLASARTQAEAERKDALAAEPWDEMWFALPGYNSDGELLFTVALRKLDTEWRLMAWAWAKGA